MGYRYNPFTGNLDYVNSGASTSAPKLTALFDCDIGVAEGDLVVVNGANTITNIMDNTISSIPNGIFGVVYQKPTTTSAYVMFLGIKDGYSGLTVGSALYISTLGEPTHTVPLTGIVQQIGFAVSSSSFFVQLMQPFARG